MKTDAMWGALQDLSQKVDRFYKRTPPGSLAKRTIRFAIPPDHPRALDEPKNPSVITSYDLRVSAVAEAIAAQKGTPLDTHYTKGFHRSPYGILVLADRAVVNHPATREVAALERVSLLPVDATEDLLKTVEGAKSLADRASDTFYTRQYRGYSSIGRPVLVVGIGGGIVCNVAAYVAESYASDLLLAPTTVLSIADSNGGKVRLNARVDGEPRKHAYKSYYEPNAIAVDPRYLQQLPTQEVRWGMAEVIKHALFQSEPLRRYLLKHEAPMNDHRRDRDNAALLKAALWTADLKRACLAADPCESPEGSGRILRAGHDISDRIEEEFELRLPHGCAVAVGIMEELKSGPPQFRSRAGELFELYGLPTAREQLYRYVRERP